MTHERVDKPLSKHINQQYVYLHRMMVTCSKMASLKQLSEASISIQRLSNQIIRLTIRNICTFNIFYTFIENNPVCNIQIVVSGQNLYFLVDFQLLTDMVISTAVVETKTRKPAR